MTTMPSAQTKFLLPVSLLQEMAALALHPVQAGPQLESLLRVLPHPHLSTSKCSGHLPGQPQSSLLPTSTPLTPNHCGHRSSLLTGLPIPHRLIHCPHSRRRVFLPANSSQTLVINHAPQFIPNILTQSQVHVSGLVASKSTCVCPGLGI